ncbi:hypothetical protein [Aquimarina sp. MMG016]|uniref:hypothetical protein n=1 Tax=Aquimarina sp. MMG016 TaxID=2822690 RepID=UPI001B39DB41|nr:hypothetical protein [Aquimarina sp. MMG016]MBQ4821410.1 hypothetical protein [Aquimarina sp. MMG016]
MRKKVRKVYWLILFSLIIIYSCQEEEREFFIEDNIPTDSELAKVMQKVVTHDGSFDDIVDGGNCYSINLPYTLLRNGNELVIDEILDYQQLLPSDDIQIQFPVMITLHNHEEKLVVDNSALEFLANTCLSNDADIECIDFVYPFKLSLFNTNTNSISTIEMGHDSQLYKFMLEIDDDILVSINYPIGLTLHNGENTSATHNIELLNTIMGVANACEEND